MARGAGRLSPVKFRRLSKIEGLHCDGGGLYFQVSKGGDGQLRRSWLFRFALPQTVVSRNGRPRQKSRDMGLGSLDTLTLAEAREKARQCRQLRLEGVDPIEHRKAQRQAAALEAAKAKTFDECRDAYLKEHRGKWRNLKHATEWSTTLKTYVTQVFGKLPVKDIDLQLVIKALEPIWSTKTETASRVRGRIEAILDWAAVSGFRSGDNPARWDLLSKRFASRSQLAPVKHHAALPYDEIGAFMADLRSRQDLSARALEFVILAAARTGEALGARWDEIDFKTRVWTVPASRTKSGKEHRVPLPDAAIALLKRMHEVRQGEYVFTGFRGPGSTLTNMAMHGLLKRMGRDELTLHGFRSTFRDWVGERTGFESEVAEAALSHAIPDKTRRAYERGDKFEKRRRLMNSWAKFCAGTEPRKADVTPLRAVS